jgi:hypothetical protein
VAAVELHARAFEAMNDSAQQIHSVFSGMMQIHRVEFDSIYVET